MTKPARFVLLALLSRVAFADFGDFPLHFEPNRGQAPAREAFVARGPGYALGLSSTEAMFRRGESTVTLRLAGANAAATAEGVGRLPGISNYITGPDQSAWRTGIPNFERVRFRGVYSGIDLEYYGNKRELEYDFVVAPGADPSAIAFWFEGTGQAKLDANGDLLLTTPTGTHVRQHRPVLFQTNSAGARQPVTGGYRLLSGNRIGFSVGAYDRHRPLVIDPVLQFATFYGGSIRESASAVAVDNSGNLYVAGLASSGDFPKTEGSVQTRVAGGNDVFVVKLNATGTQVIYSTLVGGSNDEQNISLAVDSTGAAYVAGTTRSQNFPTTPAAWRPIGTNSGDTDGFLFKLSADGSNLIYSTRVGGAGLDTVQGMTIDSSGRAYVTGQTASTDFYVSSEDVAQKDRKGFDDAFVMKFDETGSRVLYSTLLGGDADSFIVGTESGRVIAVDRIGQAYVAGITTLRDFPRTAGAFQDTHLGQSDVFLTKLATDGKQILFSTLLGGEGLDTVNAIYLEPTGTNVYIAGDTTSLRYPVTPAVYQSAQNGGDPVFRDGFIAKFNANGNIVYSTFFGGAGDDQINGITADAAGNAYVFGTTSSRNLPTSFDAIQKNISAGSTGEPYDAFLAVINPLGQQIPFATYLGGPRNEEGNAIVRDANGNLFVAGYTQSSGFPITPGALQPARTFANMAFIARIGENRPGAARITIISGDQQRVDQGTAAKEPLVVELRDAFNNPITGAVINFAATNAILPANTAFTDLNGRARMTVTMGPRPGPVTVTASYPNVPNAVFNLTSLRVGPPLPEISSIAVAGGSNPAQRVVSTNSIVTIRGDFFAPPGTNMQVGPENRFDNKAPTDFAGDCVTVDGVAGRMLLVTDKQINFIVPELPRTGPMPVVVITNCGGLGELRSDPQTVEVASTSPEFFYSQTNPDGRNPVSIIDTATGQAITEARPNQNITLVGTGFGATIPPVGTGEYPQDRAATAEPAVLTLDNREVPRQNILYAGIAPNQTGLYQIDMQVPADTRNGNLPIAVRFGLQGSPTGAYLKIVGGQDRDPKISVSPTRLDFGDVIVGQTRELPITIANSGTSVLTVRAFNTGLPVFTLLPNFGFLLDPGETRVLTMRLSADVIGPLNVNFAIATDDPLEPVLQVPMSANVIAVPPTPNPAPAITSLDRNSVDQGGAAFNLVINGTGFIAGSIVEVNGQPRSTFFNNPVQLLAFVEARDLLDARDLLITVVNPAPGGGRSAPVTLVVRGAATNQPLSLINQMDLRFCPNISSFVTVLDSAGLPVRNLSRENLTCRENDEVLDCRLFPAAAQTPLSLHLIISLNGYEKDEDILLMKSAARNLVQTLAPEDRIAITHLEDNARLLQPFTVEKDRAYFWLNEIRPVPPGNALYDSVVTSAQTTRQQEGRRQVAVLITAQTNLSGILRDFNQALGTARASGVTFYTIAVGKGKSDVDLSGFLRQLARDTHGQFFAEDVATNFGGVLGRLGAILQSQYQVEHSSRVFNGLARPLELEFRIPEGVVKATRLYSPCLP